MKFCETTNRSGNRKADYPNKQAVIDAHPEATKVVPVVGGYAVFDTWDEYETWRNQK